MDKQTARPQAADDPVSPEGPVVVGGRTEVSNVEPVQISGVGLVINLPGTGSAAPPGDFRLEMERMLRTKKFNAKELLDDPNRTTSLVLVTAVIPAGAKEGDPLTVQVTLPPNSKTTSLRGGYLAISELYTYESAENIRSSLNNAGVATAARTQTGMVKGDIWARCEGPLVMFKTNEQKTDDAPAAEVNEYKMAQVWDGGVLLKARPYFYLLSGKDQRPVVSMQIANRLNEVFQPISAGSKPIAEAKPIKPGAVVLVTVPPAYRHNHYRFLLVSRQVPVNSGQEIASLRKVLEQELVDPKTAITAAVKLEAIGPDAVPSLKLGLQSESPWVKFAAAESLAYLGRTEGAETLGEIAERHAGLRFHALKALAALDDATSTSKLAELMAHPDSQLRYGAFVSLRIADPNNDNVRGERVQGKAFNLHRVATNSTGLIHLSTNNRAEIVAFGDCTKLQGGFTLPVAGDYTVSVDELGLEAKVTRIIKTEDGAKIAKRECRPDLVNVMQAMAELGAGYAEAIEFLKRAERAKLLAASIMTDATPPGLPTQELARLARIDPTLEKTNGEALRIGASVFDVSMIPLDLPKETDTMKPPPEEKSSLNRTPGRLFGPKKVEEPVSGSSLPEASGN